MYQVLFVPVYEPVDTSGIPASPIIERGFEEVENLAMLLVAFCHSVVFLRPAEIFVFRTIFLVIGFNVFLVLCQPPVNQIGCCYRPTHVAISVIIEGLVAVEPAGSFFPGQIFFLKQQRGIHRFISITEP